MMDLMDLMDLTAEPGINMEAKLDRPKRAASDKNYLIELEGSGSDTQEYSDDEWQPEIRKERIRPGRNFLWRQNRESRSRTRRRKANTEANAKISVKSDEVRIKAKEICGSMQQIRHARQSDSGSESNSSDSESDSDSEKKQREEAERKKRSEAIDNTFEAYLFS